MILLAVIIFACIDATEILPEQTSNTIGTWLAVCGIVALAAIIVAFRLMIAHQAELDVKNYDFSPYEVSGREVFTDSDSP